MIWNCYMHIWLKLSMNSNCMTYPDNPANKSFKFSTRKFRDKFSIKKRRSAKGHEIRDWFQRIWMSSRISLADRKSLYIGITNLFVMSPLFNSQKGQIRSRQILKIRNVKSQNKLVSIITLGHWSQTYTF